MKKALSIIVASYEQPAQLENLLASISKQTFTEYEILIMDGGADEQTLEVVGRYHELPVYFHREKDKGIYDAMNKGIEKAEGDYLYFIGCDDKLYSDTVLAEVFDDTSVYNYDVVYGDAMVGRTRYDGRWTQTKLMDLNFCHQVIFVKKRVFDVVGLFDIRYKSLADWHFNIKWFTNSRIKNKYMPIIIVQYNPDGFSSFHYDDVFMKEKQSLIKKYFPLYVRLYNRWTKTGFYHRYHQASLRRQRRLSSGSSK